MIDLTVSQLLEHIENLFNIDSILSDVSVVGEVSRVTKAASGHSYFTLKDEESIIEGVIFSRGIGSHHLELGEMVRIFGRISVYKRQGRMQIMAEIIQPVGTGLIQAQIDELRKKLNAEGLFDMSRKRPIPKYPINIGVVTSEDAAAWEDIKRTVSNRFPMSKLILSHTLVQGDKAASLISEALYSFNDLTDIDLIILARGGGSPEDLLPFNDEFVARAIFASAVPVVTGIGHENDWSIADDVADYRAATPTAAAVASVPDWVKVMESITLMKNTLSDRLENILDQTKTMLEMAVSNLNSSIPDFDYSKLQLDDLIYRSSNSIDNVFNAQSDKYEKLYDNLKIMSPQATLDRGYSILHKQPTNELILKKSDVNPGDLLKITISDGIIDAIAKD